MCRRKIDILQREVIFGGEMNILQGVVISGREMNVVMEGKYIFYEGR